MVWGVNGQWVSSFQKINGLKHHADVIMTTDEDSEFCQNLQYIQLQWSKCGDHHPWRPHGLVQDVAAWVVEQLLDDSAKSPLLQIIIKLVPALISMPAKSTSASAALVG